LRFVLAEKSELSLNEKDVFRRSLSSSLRHIGHNLTL